MKKGSLKRITQNAKSKVKSTDRSCQVSGGKTKICYERAKK